MTAIDPPFLIGGAAAVVALVLLFVFLLRGRRQRIDLGEIKTTTQTLKRKRGGGAAPIAAAVDSDLTQIKGLGARAAAQLAAVGYGNIAALATLDDEGAAALDTRLGAFSGRIAQDRWVEQARLLNAGDVAGYEATFGKLGETP